MKNVSVFIFEIIIIGIMVLFGLSNKKILFFQGARSATIILGIMGMLLCTISVGKFISAAPAHPMTIMGYIFGSIAMLAFLTQLLKWNFPIIGNPRISLTVLAIAMIGNSIIAKFGYIIIKD